VPLEQRAVQSPREASADFVSQFQYRASFGAVWASPMPARPGTGRGRTLKDASSSCARPVLPGPGRHSNYVGQGPALLGRSKSIWRRCRAKATREAISNRDASSAKSPRASSGTVTGKVAQRQGGQLYFVGQFQLRRARSSFAGRNLVERRQFRHNQTGKINE